VATIRRENPRLQGLIGLGRAVDWFCANGHAVSIPLNDSQPYDLVIEDWEGGLRKVQVKTTTCRNRAGNYVVDLRTNGGNQSFHTSKPFDNRSCDLLFIVTDDDALYVIPSSAITAKASISLYEQYDRYRMDR
jgi:hypothetical protein